MFFSYFFDNRFLCDSFVIVSHPARFVKCFFRFSQIFFCARLCSRTTSETALDSLFWAAARLFFVPRFPRQLPYLTTPLPLCQALFSPFFMIVESARIRPPFHSIRHEFCPPVFHCHYALYFLGVCPYYCVLFMRLYNRKAFSFHLKNPSDFFQTMIDIILMKW